MTAQTRGMARAWSVAIGALLAITAVGAAEGWLLGRFVGPPAGYGGAALYGLAAGLLFGLFLLGTLRSPKGVEMAISTTITGIVFAMIGFGLLRRVAPGWHPTAGADRLVALGGGTGALLGLLVLFGIVAEADEEIKRERWWKEKMGKGGDAGSD